MKDFTARNFSEALREGGLKATPGRELLLTLLAKESEPVKVAEIEKKLKGKLNAVTIYRALERSWRRNWCDGWISRMGTHITNSQRRGGITPSRVQRMRKRGRY